MDCITKIAQPNERNGWNLCRFCGAQHNQNNTMNEIFLEVIKKLFSFSIETLQTYKNCDECHSHIEYICKFYKQVEKVSHTVFKIKISAKVVQLPPLVKLNSNSVFTNREIIDFDNSYKTAKEVNNFCEISGTKNSTLYSLLDEPNENSIVCFKEIMDVVDIDLHNKAFQIDIANNKEVTELIEIDQHSDVPQIDMANNREIMEVADINHYNDISEIDIANSSQQQTETCFEVSNRNERQVSEISRQESLVKNLSNCSEPSWKDEFKCAICGKILRSRTYLKFHQKLHMTEEEKQATFFKCTHCGKMYPRRKSLLHHIKWKHSEEKKEYVCDICGKKFLYQPSLRAHQKLVHELVFQREIEYKSSGKKFECEYCGKILSRKTYLKQHQKTHMSDEQKQANYLKCPYCDNRYSVKRSLLYHIECKHSNEIDKPTKLKKNKCVCNICNKVLACPSSLRNHLKMVHQNMKFKTKKCACEICGKILHSITYLKTHQKVHMSDEEKKQASFCKCPHCDAKYFRRDSLNVHIRSKHSKENPFVCKICDKVFAYRSGLALHQKTFHDKIKPEWRCDICSKTFLHKRSLMSHIKKNHEECELESDSRT